MHESAVLIDQLSRRGFAAVEQEVARCRDRRRRPGHTLLIRVDLFTRIDGVTQGTQLIEGHGVGRLGAGNRGSGRYGNLRFGSRSLGFLSFPAAAERRAERDKEQPQGSDGRTR